MKCALCKMVLTAANDSDEHLLPNAIGGRRVIRGFICRSCNNAAGHRWDSALAEQLNFLSLMLGIQRHRGEVPSRKVETVTGQEWELQPGGKLGLAKPHLERVRTDAGSLEVNIHARSMAEAKRMVEGLARKHSNIDVEKVMRGAIRRSVYPDVLKVGLSFGGTEAGRSIVKSALCLAVSAGVDPEDCPDATRYLRNPEAEACFGYYYKRDLVRARSVGMPTHCVGVSSIQVDGQLLGYVELFGAYRMIVRLARDYQGAVINAIYAIDPASSQEPSVELDLRLSRQDVDDAMNYDPAPYDGFKSALDLVMAKIMDGQLEQEWTTKLDEAVEYAFENCGATAESGITKEHLPALTSLVMERLKPFLDHHVNESDADSGSEPDQ